MKGLKILIIATILLILFSADGIEGKKKDKDKNKKNKKIAKQQNKNDGPHDARQCHLDCNKCFKRVAKNMRDMTLREHPICNTYCEATPTVCSTEWMVDMTPKTTNRCKMLCNWKDERIQHYYYNAMGWSFDCYYNYFTEGHLRDCNGIRQDIW